MTESKKIVIKINRAPGLTKTAAASRPEQITEWHLKRIAGALFAVLLLIALPFYYFSEEPEDTAPVHAVKPRPDVGGRAQKIEDDSLTIPSVPAERETMAAPMIQTPSITVASAPERVIEKNPEPLQSSVPAAQEKPENKPEEKSAKTVDPDPKTVPRALLVRNVYHKEPVGKLGSSIAVGYDKATGAFYFTEIRNRKGATFYHLWLREGKPVYKRPIKILGNRWRAVTSKLFTPSSKGQWSVRLTDGQGRIYNEIHFKVVAK